MTTPRHTLRFLWTAMLALASSAAFAGLADHPPRSAGVLYVGDADDGRLEPNQAIQAFGGSLIYQNDGNLVFYNDAGSAVWDSGTSPSCPGHAELDPNWGLTVYNCNGTRQFSTEIYQQPHTNYHLQVGPDSFTLYDMDEQKAVYTAQNGRIDVHQDYTKIKQLWVNQGYDHAGDFTQSDVLEFLELFSTNSTDPHSDAHRFLMKADIWNPGTEEHQLVRRMYSDCEYIFPDVVECADDPDTMERVGLIGDLQRALMGTMEKFDDEVRQNPNFLKEFDAFGVFNAFTKEPWRDRAITEVSRNMDLLGLYHRFRTPSDGRRFLLKECAGDNLGKLNTQLANENFDRCFYRHLHRTPQVRAALALEANLSINALASKLFNSSTKPVSKSNVWQTLEDFNVRIAGSFPRVDLENNTATWTIRLRFATFDGTNFMPGGVFSDNTPSTWGRVRRFLDKLFKSDGGVFGQKEFVWKLKDDDITDSIRQRSVEEFKVLSTQGLFFEAVADPLAAVKQLATPAGEDPYSRVDLTTLDNYNEAADITNAQSFATGNLDQSTLTPSEIRLIADYFNNSVANGSQFKDLVRAVAEESAPTFYRSAANPQIVPLGSEFVTASNPPRIQFRRATYAVSQQELTAIEAAYDNLAGAYGDAGVARQPSASTTMARAIARRVGRVNGRKATEYMNLTKVAALKNVLDTLTNTPVHASGGFAINHEYNWDVMTAKERGGMFLVHILAGTAGSAAVFAIVSGLGGDILMGIPAIRSALTAAGGTAGGTVGDWAYTTYGLEPEAYEAGHGTFSTAALKYPKWGLPDVNPVLESTWLQNTLAGNVNTHFQVTSTESALGIADWVPMRHRGLSGVDGGSGYDHNWKDLAIPEYEDAGTSPVLISRMQTMRGTDPASVRHRNFEPGSVEVKLQEEDSDGLGDIHHYTESIGSMAQAEGPILNSAGDIIGEAGRINVLTTGTNDWDRITFENQYADPVIVLSIDSYNPGSDNPAFAAVSGVAAGHADVQVREWDYLDGSHAEESMSYFVMERGTHALSDGHIVEVGIIPGGSETTSDTIFFASRFATDNTPVVLTQRQASTDTAVTRPHNIRAATGFEVETQFEEASTQTSSTDAIGYMVFGEHADQVPLGFVAAEQSSTPNTGWAELGADGDTSGYWWMNSVTHTDEASTNWWEGDLGAKRRIDTVRLYNRLDPCCTARLSDFHILISDVNFANEGQQISLAEAKAKATYWHQGSATPGMDTQSGKPYVWDVPDDAEGRYVLVYKASYGILSLAEVEVHAPLSDAVWVEFVDARQSSTYEFNDYGTAVKAIDGNVDGKFTNGSVTHTSGAETTPHWWQGDLGEVREVSGLEIFNRTDCCGDRLDDVHVFLSERSMINKSGPTTLRHVRAVAEDGKAELYRSTPVPSSNSLSWMPGYFGGGDTTARYVMIFMDRDGADVPPLSLAEVRAWGSYSDYLGYVSPGASPAPLPQEEDDPPLVVDESIPSGATTRGWEDGINWYNNRPDLSASGSRFHHLSYDPGVHQVVMENFSKELRRDDMVSTYVYLPYTNPPSGIQLQLKDDSGSWNHRVHWGEVSYGPSTYMGQLPEERNQWVKLTVPLSVLDLSAGQSVIGLAWTANGGSMNWDRTVIGQASEQEPLFVLDDVVPEGATIHGNEGMNWSDSLSSGASGSRYHSSPNATGMHQHYLTGLSVSGVDPEDTLETYVYLDPNNMPSGIQLQLNSGNWGHRVHWGAKGYGGHSTYMGALPPAGEWARLRVDLTNFDIDPGSLIEGVAWTLRDGQAWWDRTAIEPATGGPALLEVDDQLPAGAVMHGSDGWNWVTATPGPKFGDRYHGSPLASGGHQHYLRNFEVTALAGEDSLIQYVWIDPDNPPSGIQLQARLDGDWKRVHWGTVVYGPASTDMGPLPATTGWVKLRVELSDLTGAAGSISTGATLDGLAWSLRDGQAWWDRTVINPN